MRKVAVSIIAAMVVFSIAGCSQKIEESQSPQPQSIESIPERIDNVPMEMGNFSWNISGHSNRGFVAITPDDTLYFSTIDPVNKHRAFYRLRLSEKKAEKLLGNATYLDLNVVGDQLYGIRDLGAEREFPFVLISEDGTPGDTALHQSSGWNIIVAGRWIYYLENVVLGELTQSYLFRQNMATNEKEQLTSVNTLWYAIDGEWVYFTTHEDGKLTRFNPTTPEQIQVHSLWNGRIETIIIYHRRIYFIPYYDFYYKGIQTIYQGAWGETPTEFASTEEKLYDLKPLGEYIYWSTRNEDQGDIFRTNIVTAQTELSIPHSFLFQTFKDYLYYQRVENDPYEVELFLMDKYDNVTPILLY